MSNSTSLKIGMVSSDLPEEGRKPGGVSVVVHELSNALVRAGHFVRVYSHTVKPKQALYEVTPLPKMVRSKTVARRLILPFQIQRLDVKNIDVLHLHGDDWAYYFRTCPTLRTFHGCSLNESKYGDKFRRRLMHLVYHPLELFANYLANVSAGVGDDTIKILGVKNVIPNGYDERFFYPGDKAQVPTAVVVGTLEGRKQAQKAIDILLSVREEIPDLVIHAVVDREYEASSVHNWIGISQEKLSQLFRESWIGVSTTKYEGFGIYYVEWMASGTIPISFENIGVKQFILNENTGVLTGDENQLRQSILSILKNPGIRENYSQNCIRAAQKLNWDTIANQYITLYHQAISDYSRNSRLAF